LGKKKKKTGEPKAIVAAKKYRFKKGTSMCVCFSRFLLGNLQHTIGLFLLNIYKKDPTAWLPLRTKQTNCPLIRSAASFSHTRTGTGTLAEKQ